METRVLSSQLPGLVGQKVRLQGWVHRIRDFGGIRFLILRDRDGFAQIVLPGDMDIGGINCEWVVDVRGACRAEDRAPAGVEVLANKVESLSPAQPPPLEVFNPQAADKNRLETLLDHRAVALRIPDVLDVFRVQAEVLRAFRAYLNANGFTEIATPKLVLAGAEGGSALFRVDYFEQSAYLAQSPQFYKQIMVGSGLERVFEIGHVYRAEKSVTSRHLTEYVSMDFEMGFIESVGDVMRMHQGLIAAIFRTVRENCGDILRRHGVELPEVGEVPIVSFPRAQRILAERYNKTDGLNGDLDTEGEQLICKWARQEHGSEMVFVTGYHLDKRPMYTMPDLANPPLTHSFDLLFRGVEITTGGQRIHDYDQLVASIAERKLSPADYDSYLSAFRHGMPPHGGMGMGLERLVKQMLNLPNVRQASLFPRDCFRLVP